MVELENIRHVSCTICSDHYHDEPSTSQEKSDADLNAFKKRHAVCERFKKALKEYLLLIDPSEFDLEELVNGTVAENREERKKSNLPLKNYCDQFEPDTKE